MRLATLCYIHHNGCTLMLHRVKKQNDIHAGKWNGLGGKFEPGETPEECVIREVREESGLTIRNPKLVGLLMFPNFKGEDWYVFTFTATEFESQKPVFFTTPEAPRSGAEKTGFWESDEGHLKWIPDAEVESLNLWESDHIFLPWIREGKFFSAKFIYEGEQMKGYEVTFHS
ncbi:MAG: 8-oxo-dGTP diphosphatase [Chloroflexota bacterium]